MTFDEYLSSINRRLRQGIAREHSYRGDFERFIASMRSDVEVTNEPSIVTHCGNPDFVITKEDVPVGYIEAKDVGSDLSAKSYREQFDRYREGFDNLIITNYLDFEFYRSGMLVASLSIATVDGNRVVPNKADYQLLQDHYFEFCDNDTQTVTSSLQLAKLMASKARLLQSILANAIRHDEEVDNQTELRSQLDVFREVLIHDLSADDFADLYAQTLAYGLFAGRLHDSTLESFSRKEAADLIPKSNPFLRRLFQYVAGFDLDERLLPTVENLVQLFGRTDINSLLDGFKRRAGREDPLIHFYEIFLAEYNPKLRKVRGVWYTPEPVVRFIVGAVDHILKSYFSLSNGLANDSKTTIEVPSTVRDNRTATGYRTESKDIYRVQVLDPAVGTGTFLSQLINYVRDSYFSRLMGVWPEYLAHSLLPRLHGFELLMASYAVAHLKLELAVNLSDGHIPEGQRLNVYLTNALESSHPDTGMLFASFLSDEANTANHVKRDVPIMVVIGNPPYSIQSGNLSDEQRQLIDKYKYVDGQKIIEKGALQFEKNLNDDYVKFIAKAEDIVSKNGEGVIAFVNNHNYLSAPTFRGMRNHLLSTFDSIYILDLHGNSKRKEKTPDGSKDENVFDIQQGVCINIFVKRKQSAKSIARVYSSDLYGLRNEKYAELDRLSFEDWDWREIKPESPDYRFIHVNKEKRSSWMLGFSIDDLFVKSSTGVLTARDNLVIGETREEVCEKVRRFIEYQGDDKSRCKELGIRNKKGWSPAASVSELSQLDDLDSFVKPILYRPFDRRWIFYHPSVVHTQARPVMHNYLADLPNLGLVSARTNKRKSSDHFLITDVMSEAKCGESSTQSRNFPLFVVTSSESLMGTELVPNLKMTIVQEMLSRMSLSTESWSLDDSAPVTPKSIFDYVFGYLNDESYLSNYKEFVNREYARLPYPSDLDSFLDYAQYGSRLRRAFLGSAEIEKKQCHSFPRPGTNTIEVVPPERYENAVSSDGRVYINEEQFIDGMSKETWSFSVGGYQVARKWLKDRKGKSLTPAQLGTYIDVLDTVTLITEIRREWTNAKR